ncbi:MAG: flagellar motor protein MotB [Sulfurospirillaceae bacterium]|nr:flagellar motor protein MotB [Sulfurospirillaceae bacterium]MDD2826199.1 flagellar motor protein MotB [Sulfurospirillaceae bacterium]
MGKKKCKKCECEAGEKWAVPFADFFSLLLALFIALFAIASTNTEKMKALKEEFVKIYDYSSKPEEANPVVRMNAKSGDAAKDKDKGNAGGVSQTLEEISRLAQMIQKMSVGEGALDQKLDGATLKFPAKLLFMPGSAEINNDDSLLFLKRVSDIIKRLPKNVEIIVKGFTDDTALPANSKFQDNLELSSARANAVVRILMKNGVSPEKLSSAGYGETRAIALNTTEEGKEKNRRVEFTMHIFGPSDAAKKESILDTLNTLKPTE